MNKNESQFLLKPLGSIFVKTSTLMSCFFWGFKKKKRQFPGGWPHPGAPKDSLWAFEGAAGSRYLLGDFLRILADGKGVKVG